MMNSRNTRWHMLYPKSLAVILTYILLFPSLGLVSVYSQPEMLEVIVGFTDENQARQAVENAGGKVIRTYTLIPALLATIPENAIEGLQQNPNVRYVHPNGQVEAVEQVTPWGVERVKAPLVWSETTGSGVKIAILDTGIGPHEDLFVAGGTNTIGGSSYDDDNGHGTHVAGTVAALNNDIGVVGVAFDASIYSVKVLDSSGSGTIDSVVQGIQWAVDNGMDIISMSLGTKSHYDALKEAVDTAYSKGLLNVAAAGNEGNPAGKGDNIIYPARYASVIAVGATDKDDNRATFSSTGPDLELMAPGVKILSTYLNNDYTELSGTSMATPHVSGVAALVWAINPDLTNVEMRKILQDTATDLGDPGKDDKYGYGLVNAQAAVEAAAPKPVDVKIVNPSDGDTVKGTIKIQAQASADAGLSSVEYSIDSGPFNSMTYNSDNGLWEADWDTTSVADGEHTITVKATDNNGQTDSHSISVTVANTVKQLSVSVTTDKDSYQMNEWVYITVKVTDGTNPIADASVHVEVLTPSGNKYAGDGSTDSNGEVTFKFKPKKPDGTGTYQVTATASKEGYESGSGSTTFEVT